MSRTPYIAVGNNELEGRPMVHAGDKIRCPRCKKSHVLQDGTPPGTLMFYKCGSEAYLGAIQNRSIVGMKLSGGTLDLGEEGE